MHGSDLAMLGAGQSRLYHGKTLLHAAANVTFDMVQGLCGCARLGCILPAHSMDWIVIAHAPMHLHALGPCAERGAGMYKHGLYPPGDPAGLHGNPHGLHSHQG